MGLNLKSIIFLFVFVMVGGIGIIGAPLMVEAQPGILGPLLSLTNIEGTLFCTVNGNIGINGIATPTFPNATLQLRCGNENILSTTTTNALGMFSMMLSPLQVVLGVLLNSCKVIVVTPLSNCNATLPSVGSLISSLTLIGNTMNGLLNISKLAPTGFEFLPL